MKNNLRRKLMTMGIVIIIIFSVFIPLAIHYHWYPFNEVDYPFDGKLDNEYIYNMTENLSKIISDQNIYNLAEGEIAKGRFFGSNGEHHAAQLINENLSKFLDNDSYLERIKNIDYPNEWMDYWLDLATKMDVKSQELKLINETGEEKRITEFYIAPRWNDSFFKRDFNILNYTFNETNLTVFPSPRNKSCFSMGNVSWIDSFLLNESIVDNLLFNESITEIEFLYDFLISKFEHHFNFSFDKLDPNDKSTFPKGFVPFNATDNYVFIEEDPCFNPNRTVPVWEPFYLLNPPKDKLIQPIRQLINNIHKWTEVIHMILWYRLNPNCKGIIRFDFNNDTYDMNLHRFNALPYIYINGSIGRKIYNDPDNFAISYLIDQRYNNSVESYNVIGEIKGDDPDKKVIISSLYDSWWCQGTADSAIGMSIVLAIAKYFKDLKEEYNVKPKYSIKFIAFCGEEYGRVGARYYDEKYRDETIVTIIDVNQVGFNNPPPYEDRDLRLQIWTNQPLNSFFKNEVSSIVERTKYYDRTGINYTVDASISGGYVGNKDPFAINRRTEGIKTVYFVKDHGWTYHHRDGLNHTEGDVIDYYNHSDTNITAEMILNVTIGLNPLVLVGPDVFIPFVITIILMAVAVLMIFRRELFKKFERFHIREEQSSAYLTVSYKVFVDMFLRNRFLSVLSMIFIVTFPLILIPGFLVPEEVDILFYMSQVLLLFSASMIASILIFDMFFSFNVLSGIKRYVASWIKEFKTLILGFTIFIILIEIFNLFMGIYDNEYAPQINMILILVVYVGTIIFLLFFALYFDSYSIHANFFSFAKDHVTKLKSKSDKVKAYTSLLLIHNIYRRKIEMLFGKKGLAVLKTHNIVLLALKIIKLDTKTKDKKVKPIVDMLSKLEKIDPLISTQQFIDTMEIIEKKYRKDFPHITDDELTKRERYYHVTLGRMSTILAIISMIVGICISLIGPFNLL